MIIAEQTFLRYIYLLSVFIVNIFEYVENSVIVTHTYPPLRFRNF